jgi:hypothetical protein
MLTWCGVAKTSDALKFVKAIKGKPINKYAYVPVGKVRRLLQERNADDAIGWFKEMAMPPTRDLRIQHPLILVPIPKDRRRASDRVGLGSQRSSPFRRSDCVVCFQDFITASIFASMDIRRPE